MTSQSALLLITFLVLLLALSYPLGKFIVPVALGSSEHAPVPGLAWCNKLERWIYRYAGISTQSEMSWKTYAFSLLVFNTLGAFISYVLQRVQLWLPLNPQHLANLSPDSAFNTAISFVSNTNWQAYAGENSMSYLTQMLALAVQNFLSAATGIAVAFALIRGFSRHSTWAIGNFWTDLIRSTLYILLPLSILLSVILLSQGVIQNFDSYQPATLIQAPSINPDTQTNQQQILAMGPVASQEAIKMLGTNGGGFFNANSAHPYENPTPLSNFIEMLAILLIPAALCFTFGFMVGDIRQGWALLVAMTLLFILMTVLLMAFEQQPNLSLPILDQTHSALQSGGNMEGKETRFGISGSTLFAAVTTAASCGAVNAMHDSFTALGGLIPLALIQLGEVVFGGVGSGLYGMLIFAIMAVFIAGLMTGRTPEYLGKKIQTFEMKMIAIAILITPLLVLGGTAIAVMTQAGTSAIFNPGPHGFSEILYAFSSAANNNGSAFGGLSANTPFYNIMLAIAMWFGRFIPIVVILALAGSFATKKRLAANPGTMPTNSPLFVLLLIGIVILVGVLNYVPALALGPIAEHLLTK